jgi:large subunit ribosomal protein L25
MSDINMKINAEVRSVQGTGASRRLRRAGKVPAVVYGAQEGADMIELDHKETLMQLKKEAFHASILDMSLGGKSQKVLLRDYQMHPWKMEVLHVDFQRVSAKEKITMRVPLHFINEENAPSVKLGGGVVNHIESDVEVICLPGDLPEFIEVDCGALEIGESISLSQLNLPSGVESAHLGRGGEDLGLVAIQKARGGSADEEASDVDASEDKNANSTESADEDKGASSEA